MTIIVDDAGSGDLLFGVVIGAYRLETGEFKYRIVPVKFFQPDLYCGKGYLAESSKVVEELLAVLKLKSEEQIHLCQGYIFDDSATELKKTYGEERIQRIRVTGEAQRLTEIAYLDEIRNLGYEPLEEREEKRARSFFHMMRWLKANPDKLQYAKTGWPRLKRYRLFQTQDEDAAPKYTALCNECNNECEVPFKPDPHRAVYCHRCWAKRRKKSKLKSRKA